MFGTIRKHQSWLWFIIIGVMIFSMATFVQMNKNGNGQRGGGIRGEIDGKPVTDTEFQNAWKEAAIMYFLTYREFPDTTTPRNGWNQDQQTYQRLLLTRKLDQYNIRVDSESAAQLANVFLRNIGRGESVPVDQFMQALQQHNISQEDFQRFLEHYLGIQQLISVVGASGTLVPPEEIKALYIEEHQEVKAQAVVFSASNYLATIPEPTAALLAQFYTNELDQYKEPDRMQVSYVRFNITNYLADAQQKLGTNIDNQMEEIFRREGTNVLTLGKTEAEQKTKLRELIIRGVALTNAYGAALSFQKELMAKDPVRPDNLDTLAKQKGLEVKVSKPFDKEYGPSDFRLTQDYPVSELFNLTPDDPFTYTPLKSEDGYYVLAFNKSIPARVPPLDEIRSRVVADCKEFEATRTAQMKARLFESTATNGLARGQTFAEICATANIKPMDLPPFSVSTEALPEVEDEVEDLNAFKQVVISTQVGKMSGFIPTRSGAMVVYVRERLPVDPAKMQADLPNFSKLVRQARERQAFDMWFDKEYQPIARALQQQRGKS